MTMEAGEKGMLRQKKVSIYSHGENQQQYNSVMLIDFIDKCTKVKISPTWAVLGPPR